MICPNCGHTAKDNDRFCIKCGSLLKKPEPEPIEEPAPVEAAEAVETVCEEAAEAVEAVPEEAAEAVEAVCEEAAAAPEKALDEFGIEPADPCAVEPAPVEEPAPVAEPAPVEEPAPVREEYVAEPEPVVIPPVKEAPAENKSVLDKPLSVWGYLWRIVLFAIPIFNIIPLFTMAFSSGINKNSKHFASAVLIIMIIGMLICIGILIAALAISDPTSIRDTLTRIFT